MTSAHHPDRVEIRVQGHLDERWSSWFDGMDIEAEAGGITILHGQVADQAALHGLLARLRDLGIPLVSVALGLTTTTPQQKPPAPGKAASHDHHRDHQKDVQDGGAV